MVVTMDGLRATRANIAAVVAALQPLAGNYWLAMDRSTRCHWVIEAATVQSKRGGRYAASGPVVTSIATVISRTAAAVFVIEAHDTLEWTIPGETLTVREGRLRGSETVLQRLDDIDAPTMSREALLRQLSRGEAIPAIGTRRDRFVEIASCLLPTGRDEIDRDLQDIECAILSHCAGRRPEETLQELDRRLVQIAGHPALESYVWIVAQRELIQCLLSQTAPR